MVPPIPKSPRGFFFAGIREIDINQNFPFSLSTKYHKICLRTNDQPMEKMVAMVPPIPKSPNQKFQVESFFSPVPPIGTMLDVRPTLCQDLTTPFGLPFA